MAYSALTFTASEVPTLTKWNQLWANDASMNDGTGIGNAVINFRQLAAGVVVQMVGSVYNAAATGTTIIPQDDTVPQNTEGDQYMSQTITPKASTNTLIVQVEIMFSNNANSGKIVGLFQDSNVNALAAKFTYQGNWTDPTMLTMVHIMTAGTTSPTTFKVRAGGSVAGTTTFNGANGGRQFGTTSKSSILVTEVKV